MNPSLIMIKEKETVGIDSRGTSAGNVFGAGVLLRFDVEYDGVRRMIIQHDCENIDSEKESIVKDVERYQTFQHDNVAKIYGYCNGAFEEIKHTDKANGTIEYEYKYYDIKGFMILTEIGLCTLHDIVCNKLSEGCNKVKRMYNSLPIVQWLRDIANGLAYLHSVGVVHCNINFKNIILCDDQAGNITAKLTGLCFSHVYNLRDSDNRRTTDISIARSYAQYFAPELYKFKVRPLHTYASDMYAYGILANQLLKMQLPNLDGVKIVEHVNGIFRGERPMLYVPTSVVEASIMHLVGNADMCCLATAPNKRPTAKEATDYLDKSIELCAMGTKIQNKQ